MMLRVRWGRTLSIGTLLGCVLVLAVLILSGCGAQDEVRLTREVCEQSVIDKYQAYLRGHRGASMMAALDARISRCVYEGLL